VTIIVELATTLAVTSTEAHYEEILQYSVQKGLRGNYDLQLIMG
jgi:hypothetical protein